MRILRWISRVYRRVWYGTPMTHVGEIAISDSNRAASDARLGVLGQGSGVGAPFSGGF